LDPSFAIGSYEFDNPSKFLTLKSFAFENLSDFFSFTLRREVDVTILDILQSSPIVMFRFSAEIVAGRHRESVSKQIRKSQCQDNLG
jgi:hypothetical protein